MLAFRRLFSPASADEDHLLLPLTQNDVVDTTEEEAKVRAVNTIIALSALFGEPLLPHNASSNTNTNSNRDIQQDDKDSVASWASQAFPVSSKDHLTGPMVCPPFSDPSSVMIPDQVSLEYELEDLEEEEALRVSTTTGRNSTGKESATAQPANKNKVRFHDMVCVVKIPSHRDMDPDQVQRIWSSSDEVHLNAQRSSMEYHADGRNWELVKEEDDMIYDEATGEYIHPATWEDMQFEIQQQVYAEAERQRRLQAAATMAAERDHAESSITSPISSSSKGKKRSPKQQRRKQTQPSRTFRRTAMLEQRCVPSLTRFADT